MPNGYLSDSCYSPKYRIAVVREMRALASALELLYRDKLTFQQRVQLGTT
jgi:hypothetical protein